ncbi:hypothetical protein ABZP36_011291 [Zizania latifolia]
MWADGAFSMMWERYEEAVDSLAAAPLLTTTGLLEQLNVTRHTKGDFAKDAVTLGHFVHPSVRQVVVSPHNVGGGVPEHKRALELSELLGVNISLAQHSEWTTDSGRGDRGGHQRTDPPDRELGATNDEQMHQIRELGAVADGWCGCDG